MSRYNLIVTGTEWFRDLGITLEEPVSGNQLRCPDDGKARYSVTLEEGRLLAAFAAGKRVLEIGTGLGISTKCMAATARCVVTVDPDPWVHDNLKLSDNVTLCAGIEQAAALGPFDMAFIDGEHDYGSVKRDIQDAIRLRDHMPYLLVFHDCGQIDVFRAVSEFDAEFVRMATFETCGMLTVGVLA